MRRIYPEKGFTPTPADYQALASAVLPFGLAAYVGREKTKSGYRKFVGIHRPVEFGSMIKAPADGANIDEGTGKEPL